MTSLMAPRRQHSVASGGTPSVVSGLVLVAAAVAVARLASSAVAAVPFIVAAVLVGALIGNSGLAGNATAPGLAFASETLLRAGIVLLGLRLSAADVAALGVEVLLVIAGTVTFTFFAVQFVGRRLGLSPALSLLVASGFSICGNSAIASVKEVTPADDEEVAAAIGLVTVCGTAAIAVVPAIGSLLGLSDLQLGVWTGAGVQDTAQVIAVAAAAGPTVLAVATAVKLTRVLFLAPIVAGVSVWNRRLVGECSGCRPAPLPLFVVGFLAALLLRSAGLVPVKGLALGRDLEQYLLAAGMVGLGSSVTLRRLRSVGGRVLVLGALAWLIVAGVSLGLIALVGV